MLFDQLLREFREHPSERSAFPVAPVEDQPSSTPPLDRLGAELVDAELETLRDQRRIEVARRAGMQVLIELLITEWLGISLVAVLPVPGVWGRPAALASASPAPAASHNRALAATSGHKSVTTDFRLANCWPTY